MFLNLTIWTYRFKLEYDQNRHDMPKSWDLNKYKGEYPYERQGTC